MLRFRVIFLPGVAEFPVRYSCDRKGANRTLAGMRLLFAHLFVNKFYLTTAASPSPPAVTAKQKCSLMPIGARFRNYLLTNPWVPGHDPDALLHGFG